MQALSRIKKLSGKNLHRNWLLVPHVTQFGEADITELEAFRVEQKANIEKQGIKLTPLIFIMKATSEAQCQGNERRTQRKQNVIISVMV